MRGRNAKIVLLVLLSVLLVVGCATTQNVTVPNLTPIQKAQMTSLGFMERYAAQLKDATAMGKMAVAGTLSPGQLEVYRMKRKLLIKAEPLVLGFDRLVNSGVIPGADKEIEVNQVLNELLAAGGV